MSPLQRDLSGAAYLNYSRRALLLPPSLRSLLCGLSQFTYLQPVSRTRLLAPQEQGSLSLLLPDTRPGPTWNLVPSKVVIHGLVSKALGRERRYLDKEHQDPGDHGGQEGLSEEGGTRHLRSEG